MINFLYKYSCTFNLQSHAVAHTLLVHLLIHSNLKKKYQKMARSSNKMYLNKIVSTFKISTFMMMFSFIKIEITCILQIYYIPNIAKNKVINIFT